MNVRFHREARLEWRDAIRFYEACRSGLGERFRQIIERAIESIAADPLRWRLWEADARRYIVRGFPFQVIYFFECDTVFIVAVMHCSREPGYWHERTDLEPT